LLRVTLARIARIELHISLAHFETFVRFANPILEGIGFLYEFEAALEIALSV
jgi:hypothetical protein